MVTLYRSPPNIPVNRQKGYGEYYIRARCRLINRDNSEYAVITGYDVNMSICKRVERFSLSQARHKRKASTVVEVVFVGNMNSEFEDGTIIMDYIDAKQRMIIPSIYLNED